jgi:hypothetical protein
VVCGSDAVLVENYPSAAVASVVGRAPASAKAGNTF